MNNINGKNQYCGPSVLAAIAGITTDEAEAFLQQSRDDYRPVKGVWPSEIRTAFSKLGYQTLTVNLPRGTKIFRVTFMLGENSGIYVFEVPIHVDAIEINGMNRYLCDNHTKEPISISNSARLNQKIQSVVKVIKK